MPAEEVGRHQLVYIWQRQAHSLRAQGQCAAHIESFLERLAQVPGEDVSEISLRWCRLHAERRPMLVLLTLVLALLALGCPMVGPILAVLVGSLGLRSFLLSWKVERAFAQELFARATYSLHCPHF
jgi:hypothetical protein